MTMKNYKARHYITNHADYGIIWPDIYRESADKISRNPYNLIIDKLQSCSYLG